MMRYWARRHTEAIVTTFQHILRHRRPWNSIGFCSLRRQSRRVWPECLHYLGHATKIARPISPSDARKDMRQILCGYVSPQIYRLRFGRRSTSISPVTLGQKPGIVWDREMPRSIELFDQWSPTGKSMAADAVELMSPFVSRLHDYEWQPCLFGMRADLTVLLPIGFW